MNNKKCMSVFLFCSALCLPSCAAIKGWISSIMGGKSDSASSVSTVSSSSVPVDGTSAVKTYSFSSGQYGSDQPADLNSFGYMKANSTGKTTVCRVLPISELYSLADGYEKVALGIRDDAVGIQTSINGNAGFDWDWYTDRPGFDTRLGLTSDESSFSTFYKTVAGVRFRFISWTLAALKSTVPANEDKSGPDKNGAIVNFGFKAVFYDTTFGNPAIAYFAY